MNKGLPPNFVNGGSFISTHFVTQNEQKCLEKVLRFLTPCLERV